MQCKASVWFAKDRHVLEKIVVEPKPKKKQRNDMTYRVFLERWIFKLSSQNLHNTL